ncbi:MFS transporter [Metabacillus litoralis]|uniref:MFS transporter n=1 Tax=Metabacillus litoralis TaxID=152268 RepID=UPI00204266B8|nr:MFS transporter [Metabacillus litoralis]MCM3654275.1 MFS transporter [Metabacillus litoralis]
MGKLSKNFWIFGTFFFLYFFIWAACLPFLSLWLTDVVGLSSTKTGIVFSAMSIAAICYQPFFGIVSDKLGLKRNLLWVFVILLIFIAPFYNYIFAPLLQTNIIIGSLIGGAYLGAVFNGGVGAIEAYIEKVSRVNSFEYGQVRMFGCIGAATSTFVTGQLFTSNPTLIFWISSIVAVLLAVLLFFSKTDTKHSILNEEKNAEPLTTAQTLSIFKNKKFWFLMLYVLGVGCIYDVYDQQFAVFFTHFFESPEKGTEVFGNLYTLQIFMEAVIMLLAPFIINKIGAKNALLYAGFIMSIRIIGSGLADGPIIISILKLLHALEVPILLVAVFKYISANFDLRLSATIYLIGFQFSKQVGSIFLSAIVGNMYDTVGFKSAYLLLGMIALTFTIISIFTLSSKKSLNMNKRDLNSHTQKSA